MVSQTAVEARFRERVKLERDRRKWSQADLAKRLSDRGVKGIYPTTIAKIESGERAVRIDEAVALADLFEVSLDAILGRNSPTHPTELAYQLCLLRDTARESLEGVWAWMERIRRQLDELGDGFEYGPMLQEMGKSTWDEHLRSGFNSLGRLMVVSQQLMLREEGKPELSDADLNEYLVRLGSEDEAQP